MKGMLKEKRIHREKLGKETERQTKKPDREKMRIDDNP